MFPKAAGSSKRRGAEARSSQQQTLGPLRWKRFRWDHTGGGRGGQGDRKVTGLPRRRKERLDMAFDMFHPCSIGVVL